MNLLKGVPAPLRGMEKVIAASGDPAAQDMRVMSKPIGQGPASNVTSWLRGMPSRVYDGYRSQ